MIFFVLYEQKTNPIRDTNKCRAEQNTQISFFLFLHRFASKQFKMSNVSLDYLIYPYLDLDLNILLFLSL